MRTLPVILAAAVVLGLSLWLSQVVVRPGLEREFRRDLLEDLAGEAGMDQVEVEVDGFAVELSGVVEQSWQRQQAERKVHSFFPLFVPSTGNQIGVPSRLQVVQCEGKIGFIDSAMSASERARLRAWAERNRPDLKRRLEWDDIEIGGWCLALDSPWDYKGIPPQESLAFPLWGLLQEPAKLIAWRQPEGGLRLVAAFPDGEWKEQLDRALEELPDSRRPDWEWGPEGLGLRSGEHVTRAGFVQAGPAEVANFVVELLADGRTRVVIWHGGDGGYFEWIRDGSFLDTELDFYRRRASELNGLPLGRALRVE